MIPRPIRSSAIPLSILLGASAAGCARRVSLEEARSTARVLAAVSAAPSSPREIRARLLYQGCAELPTCAAGCAREIEACAAPLTDPSQCAALIASCGSLDYRSRADRGERLSPAAWIEGRVRAQLDDARKGLPPDEQPAFDAGRRQAGL